MVQNNIENNIDTIYLFRNTSIPWSYTLENIYQIDLKLQLDQ